MGNVFSTFMVNLSHDFRQQVSYSLIILTLFAVGFCFLPDTPNYLRQINNNTVFLFCFSFYRIYGILMVQKPLC